jgi:hypothetical protein
VLSGYVLVNLSEDVEEEVFDFFGDVRKLFAENVRTNFIPV